MNASYLIYPGLAFVLLGFLLVFAGMLSAGASQGGGAGVHGGGVVFVGPIPLVFGTDKSSAVTVAVLGVILMLAFYFLFYRRMG